MQTKKKPKNYLNNSDLLAELRKSREKGNMTDALARMFLELTSRYSKIPRFVNYTYNDDMQSFALLILTKVWRSFDETKTQNPFAYFTRTVHRAFFQYDNMERKQRDIRDALLVDQGQNPSFSYSSRHSDDEGDAVETVARDIINSEDSFYNENNEIKDNDVESILNGNSDEI